MFAESSIAFGALLIAGSILVWLLLVYLALHSSRYTPTPCQVCEELEDSRPALEHDWNCPLRLAFFGGQPHWDQAELQVQNGVVFYFDRNVGSWRPQLWDSTEQHTSLEK